MTELFLTTTYTSSQELSSAIAEGITALFTLAAIGFVIGIGFLVAIVALITWVVKKVWYAGRGKPKQNYRRNDGDWLTTAQRRQQQQYEYNDPQWTHHTSPTGWTYNAATGKWEPPKSLSKKRK